MAVNIPFSDERYMQLMAQGFNDKECAMKMHVKKNILVREYLPHILVKHELSSRKELAAYARRQGYGTQIALPPDEVIVDLKGVKTVQARSFYRALEQHYFQNKCPGCKSYKQYAILLVHSQFYEHMQLFIPSTEHNVFELIESLKESGMIEVHNDEETYRITFKHLQTAEGYNDGDSNI